MVPLFLFRRLHPQLALRQAGGTRAENSTGNHGLLSSKLYVRQGLTMVFLAIYSLSLDFSCRGSFAWADLDWLRKRAGGTVNSRLNARLKAASDS